MISKEVLSKAKAITKLYGRGFYRASFLFPKKTREATWVLYAFVRIPDEMVDSEPDKSVAKASLEKWMADWEKVVNGSKEQSLDPILFAAKEVFDEHKIDIKYSYDFLSAMHQDLETTRYQSYKELESYMYGSASVIGIMMSHIIGFKEGALPYAKSLGEAFQLINFLRDTQDDYRTRGRIYISKEDMDRFGVSEDHIKNSINDSAWKALMSFEVARAKGLLEEGRKGIPLLNGRGQKAVYASYLIYKKILEEIERLDYDTFSRRVVISPLDKTMLLLKALWNKSL